MPNWTDDEGFSWFGVLECKRCLNRFKADENNEVPVHDCIGGLYYSASSDGKYHYPVKVCDHEWYYLGGHNEWWFCRKCGAYKR